MKKVMLVFILLTLLVVGYYRHVDMVTVVPAYDATWETLIVQVNGSLDFNPEDVAVINSGSKTTTVQEVCTQVGYVLIPKSQKPFWK